MKRTEPGDRVEIFVDPITQKKSEGWAVLRNLEMIDAFGPAEFWEVEFEDDVEPRQLFGRWIHPPPAR